MKKVIVTPAGQSEVDLTQAELDDIAARKTANEADAPRKLWEAEMRKTDSLLPRWAEDIIDKIGSADLPQETLDLYNAKKTKRSEKP